MADTKSTDQQDPQSQLLLLLISKSYDEVAEQCKMHPEGPLQRISIYNDTVLHMASRFKQSKLVLDLLKILPQDGKHQLADKENNVGSSILHEVAASDIMIDVAKEMLKKEPKLLTARNKLGETPIFGAARHGQINMFKFLDGEMERRHEDDKQYLQRNDKTTVLHISVVIECFELARFIVDKYPYLIEERDQDSMTTFQYLACNPAAFGKQKTKVRKGFMEELMSSKVFESESEILEKLIIAKQSKEESKTSDKSSHLEYLVKLLAKKDTSWYISLNSQEVGRGKTKELEVERDSSEYKKSDETPLFLATISNIQEIVKEILACHPQALERTNKDGMNILHVAILYRHIAIFDMVVNSEALARSLLSATDNKGNSLLHMVGQKRKSQASERMQSPAFQLRKELQLFEKVKTACNMHFTKPLNKDNKTAEELFVDSNAQLHKEAKEWLLRTTENCTILSVFVATVAFAAAYTIPGGSDESTGIPILNSKPFFRVFVLADVISLALALTSVGIFLSILTSSFPLEDFKRYLFRNLIIGTSSLILSVSMMAVAFGATIVLIMAHNWKNAFWHVVAFLPVPIFFLSYSAFLGFCGQLLKKFAFAVMIFIFFVIILLYIGGQSVCWIVKKAFPCLKGKPNAESRQQTAAPHTQV